MLDEFLAGFLSGIGGLIIGSPLDVLKTIQQNSAADPAAHIQFMLPRASWFTGLLMPVMSLGIMNGILFWSYHLAMLDNFTSKGEMCRLMNHFLAGAFAGLCVCFISIPTETVKVRAQVLRIRSTEVMTQIAKDDGVRGFYRGSQITIVRDVVGYAFYFAAYEVFCLFMPQYLPEPWNLLTAGGLAGCVSWLSIFPLDTIKTNIQADRATIAEPLIVDPHSEETLRSVFRNKAAFYQEQECAKNIYRMHGVSGFFSGLKVTMIRAFCVNAVIFSLEKWIRQTLG